MNRPQPPLASSIHAPGDRADIRIRAASYGRFPEADELNPEFSPRSRRLEMTLEVSGGEALARCDPARILKQLQELLPGLERHRCCGASRIGRSLFRKERGGEPGSDAVEVSADLAHLLEHVLIDLQDLIGGATRAAGVTCGHWDPPFLYDLFVESPDPICAWVSCRLGVSILNDHLACRPSTDLYRQGIRVAASLYRCRPWTRSVGELAAVSDGSPEMSRQVIWHLLERGVLETVKMSVNLSGEDYYGLAVSSFPWQEEAA